jgi:hypothetical protein
VFAAPDILLTVREGALMAQHFDLTLRSLTGQAQLLANSIDTFTGYGSAAITASSTGLLAYSDSGLLEIKNSQLLWRERNGAILGAFDERRDYQMVNLSKDDARLAIGLQSPTTRTADVWIGDVARNNMSQFAASSAGEYDPQWSGPASDRIAFTLDRARLTGLAVKSVIDAGEPRKLFESDEVAALGDWSVDGRYILYQLLNGAQIYALPMSGEDRTPIRVLDSPSTKDQERLSPDGKWMAYNANDSGRFEVYVVSFPIAGRPIPVSIDGGVQPRWRRDMKELFYLAPDGMLMAVDVVQTATDLEFRTPHPLFQTGLVSPSMGWEQYDVTRDGQKFIVITPPAERPARGVNLLLNWQTKIK